MANPLHFLSLVTVPVAVICAGSDYTPPATGFFHSRKDGMINFVTNWHVVTGRYPQSPLHSTQGIPTKLKLCTHKKQNTSSILLDETIDIEIPINDDDGNSPLWLEHPLYGYNVDIVVIKVPEHHLNGATIHMLTDYKQFEQRYEPEVSDEVFILGYPWGLKGGGKVLPIWKRGSIASDPIVPFGRLPRMLIDSKSTSGMSGSPVIVSHSGIWNPSGDCKRMDGGGIIGTITNFLGVYSGRLRTTDYQEEEKISDIGVVWRASLIEEIIGGNRIGSSLSDIINAN